MNWKKNVHFNIKQYNNQIIIIGEKEIENIF